MVRHERPNDQNRPLITYICDDKQKQTVETLINEETLLFAKYLRNERSVWKPRIA